MVDSINVLHVDDEQAILDLTAELLERAMPAISVRSETRPEAVESIIVNQDIDCIVSDLDMPRCNGIELCNRIRATHPEIPFIIFSSRNDDCVSDTAADVEVTGYVQKRPGIDHYEELAKRITIAVHGQDQVDTSQSESTYHV